MGLTGIYERAKTKAYLRIESGAYIQEIEGELYQCDIKRECEDYGYSRGSFMEYSPGPTKLTTKLEWGYGTEYKSWKIPKPVPTEDMPELGEFYD